jgi:hypothetical protein
VFFEVLDGLWASVFEDVEVFRLEAGDGVAFGVRDRDVLNHELDAGSDGRYAIGSLE